MKNKFLVFDSKLVPIKYQNMEKCGEERAHQNSTSSCIFQECNWYKARQASTILCTDPSCKARIRRTVASPHCWVPSWPEVTLGHFQNYLFGLTLIFQISFLKKAMLLSHIFSISLCISVMEFFLLLPPLSFCWGRTWMMILIWLRAWYKSVSSEKALFVFKPFIESSQKFYHAGLEKLNFMKAPEDARKHINTWVDEQTTGD